MKPENYKGLRVSFKTKTVKVLMRGKEKLSENKSPLYLFNLKAKKYISSLYPFPEKEGIFAFEEYGKAYKLDLESSQIAPISLSSYLGCKGIWKREYHLKEDLGVKNY